MGRLALSFLGWCLVVEAAHGGGVVHKPPATSSVETVLFSELSTESDGDHSATGGDEDNDKEHLKVVVEHLRQELHNATARTEIAEAEAAKEEHKFKEEEDEVKQINASLAAIRKQVQQAKEEASEVRARLKALQAQDGKTVGPVAIWVSALPHQEALAAVVGILGLLSVFGPSAFTRAFLSIAGSSVAGLMVAGCFGFFAGGPTWVDSVEALLMGDGFLVGYCLWGLLLALGIVRWLVGFNCSLYANVNEVALDHKGRVLGAGTGSLQRPLLDPERG